LFPGDPVKESGENLLAIEWVDVIARKTITYHPLPKI